MLKLRNFISVTHPWSPAVFDSTGSQFSEHTDILESDLQPRNDSRFPHCTFKILTNDEDIR